jgi:succinoglycan biosynthesis protein ExoO
MSGNTALSVSIIIPAYNCEAFIGRAVASATGQSLAPLEVIVVDDCSTDGTRAAVAALAVADPRIKMIAMPLNGGPSAARNAGIAAASGGWIAILDADDAFAPGRLSRLVPFAVGVGADLVADDLAYYDAVAERATGRAMAHEVWPAGKAISLHDYFSHNLASGESFDWGLLKPIFRRSTWLDHGIQYDPALRHGEDFKLVTELLCRGARFHLLNEPFYLYTQRYGAVSGRSSGMSRTTIGYAALRDATTALSRDARIARDPELVALLQHRARGLGRMDDAYFISVAFRSAAIGSILSRVREDPSFLPFMAAPLGRAVARRLSRR